MLRGLFSRRISAETFLKAAVDNDLVTVQNYIAENTSNVAAINRADPKGNIFALNAAAYLGHLEILKALLAVPGIDPNVADPNGDTPLMLAARAGHMTAVKALLSTPHLKFSLRNKLDYTAAEVADTHGHGNIAHLITTEKNARAFRKAAREGALDHVKEYIAANINNVALINAPNINGLTALTLAATRGHVTVVNALLGARGIAVNLRDKNGLTALIRAAHNGHVDCVAALINAEGMDGNSVDCNGSTALIHAAYHGHTDVVRVLIAKISINLTIQNNDHLTAARAAVKNHHTEIVQLIEAAAAAPAQGKSLLNTPIQNLVREDSLRNSNAIISAQQFLNAASTHFSTIQTIRDYISVHGTDPVAMNVTNPQGRTALHLACFADKPGTVRLLLNAPGVDVSARDQGGLTALMYAAHKSFSCIQALLESSRIEVNVQDSSGATALFHAASVGRERTVISLLNDSRVSVRIKNYLHVSALQESNARGYLNIARLIENAVIARRTAIPSSTISAEQFFEAAEDGDLAIVEAYMAANRDNSGALNSLNENGYSALQIACLEGNYSIVTALLSNPAINVNRTQYETPALLLGISRTHRANITAALLARPEIDVNAIDDANDGDTALIKAVEYPREDVILLLLRDPRTDLTAVEYEQNTASEVARFGFEDNIAELIEETIIARRNAIASLTDTPPIVSSTISTAQFLDAARVGDLATVQAYIAEHRDDAAAINVTDEFGQCALHWAAMLGHARIILTLRDVPVIDANVRNKLGSTPLMIAIDQDIAIMTELSTFRGIEVNATDNNGNTALCRAARAGRREIVNFLVGDNRVNLAVRNNRGETAAEQARNRGHQSIAQMITSFIAERATLSPARPGTPLPAPTEMIISPQRFLVGARDGDLRSVQSYIAAHRSDLAGAINVIDLASGDSALIMAASAGQQHVVTELLNTQGVNIELQNRNNLNAAQEAERNGHEEIATRLMQLISARATPAAAPAPIPAPANNAVVAAELNFEQRLESISYDGPIPDHLKCPISHCIMNDPITVNGQTFDRRNLKIWAAGKSTFICPLTKAPISSAELENKTTISIKSLIEKFVMEQVAAHTKKVEEAKRQAALATAQESPTGLRLFDSLQNDKPQEPRAPSPKS